MKVVEFKDGMYLPVQINIGEFRPLAVHSLAEQLVAWREEVSVQDPPRFLVFAPEEWQVVEEAVHLLANNVGRNRGLGRMDSLDWDLLKWLVQKVGWEAVIIPTDGDARVLTVQVQSWSIAMRPLP